MTVVIRGVASDLDRGHDNTVIARGDGAAHIVNQLASFRVNGKAVAFKSRSLISVKDGDEVVAAGALKNGVLQALAVRNVSTGAIYSHSLIAPIILTSLLGLIGLASLSIGIGFAILPIAGFVGWKIWNAAQAVAAVKAD